MSFHLYVAKSGECLWLRSAWSRVAFSHFCRAQDMLRPIGPAPKRVWPAPFVDLERNFAMGGKALKIWWILQFPVWILAKKRLWRCRALWPTDPGLHRADCRADTFAALRLVDRLGYRFLVRALLPWGF